MSLALAPVSAIARSLSSSACIHRGKTGQTGFFISPSPSALPDVAGLGPSVAGGFNVKSQPVTFPEVVWIDARCFECGSV
jgi:hypothetical protein